MGFIRSGTCKRTVNIPVYATKSLREGAYTFQQRNHNSNVATANIVTDIAVPEIPGQAFPTNIRTNDISRLFHSKRDSENARISWILSRVFCHSSTEDFSCMVPEEKEMIKMKAAPPQRDSFFYSISMNLSNIDNLEFFCHIQISLYTTSIVLSFLCFFRKIMNLLFKSISYQIIKQYRNGSLKRF